MSIVVLVILVVIIVPTAVILSDRQSSKGLASSLILPLYIYPLADNGHAWQPLYNAYVFHLPNSVHDKSKTSVGSTQPLISTTRLSSTRTVALGTRLCQMMTISRLSRSSTHIPMREPWAT